MWYNLTIKDNIITVKNLSSDSTVVVTMYVTTKCDNTYTQVIESYQVDFEEVKKLPNIDGIYMIRIKRVVGTTVVETIEAIYPYFGMLIKSIIRSTESILCGCDCANCDDCIKDDKEVLDLVLKSFSYYVLLYKYYSRFYDAVFNCLNCSITEISNCILVNENFIGNPDNQDLLKKILSSFYLSFYFAELYNTEDAEYINRKFKYNKIIKCISATNTDIKCITEQIENNMGLFSIQFDRYINQPPSEVGDYNAGTVANRASITITPAMVTSLTTPPYADPEGDSPQALRVDTLATNGAVLTYNNNPVTVGQIITITDMAANMFKIVGPNTQTLTGSSWNFSIRDTGSMQFTS